MPNAASTPAPRTPPRWTLRMRLTLWVVAIFALIQWATGGVFWLYQESSIQRLLEKVLVERVKLLADEVSTKLPVLSENDVLAFDRRIRSVEFGRFYFDVYNEQGESVLASPSEIRSSWGEMPLVKALNSPSPVLTRLYPESSETLDPSAREIHAALARTEDAMERPYIVVLASTDAFPRRQMALLARVLVIAGLVGPIAAGVAGWFIAGIAVAPFERLREFARYLSPGSLQEEISFESDNAEVDQLATELAEARRRTNEAFAAQERFLSHVSHELKTPIAVMAIEAQTIDTSKMPEEARDFIEQTREEMLRLGQLVESFLTLTRVQDGKANTPQRITPVNDIVMDSVDHCLLMARQHDVHIHPRLLDADDTIHASIAGDPELLCTLLENLIRNAIRFSPTGGRIDVRAATEEAIAVVRVSDEGPGIPPDRLETIFDRFAQLENGQRTGRGHGLGLAIAQGIAELHGGRVRAMNQDAGGAIFEVRLPLTPASPHAASRSSD
ncbi:MAG: HAMP domain-containing sensor histidine kinase [Phycisphaerales bacterium]